MKHKLKKPTRVKEKKKSQIIIKMFYFHYSSLMNRINQAIYSS